MVSFSVVSAVADVTSASSQGWEKGPWGWALSIAIFSVPFVVGIGSSMASEAAREGRR